MSFLFLIPLLVAVGTVYLTRNSGDEIAYLSASVTVGSLLLSLILAPWQIQLLLTIAAVATVAVLRRKRAEYRDETVESPVAGDKKYRGVAYRENPAGNGSKTEVEGKYRGASLKINNRPGVAAPVRASILKYRGATVPGDEKTG